MEQKKSEYFNRKEAYKYFGLKCGDAKGYCLHHKDVTLRKSNPERYKEWRPEDLVLLTSSEHAILHHKGTKRSEESKKKRKESFDKKCAIMPSEKTDTYNIHNIAFAYGKTQKIVSRWIRSGAIPFVRIKGTRIYIKKEEK